MNGHTGYIALLGRPNTGKSTFLNAVLECHIAAVSSKPQTTRRSLLGIYTDDTSQIIFLDSPGVHPGKIALDEAMAESVNKVLEDADIILCLIDPTRAPGEEDGLAARLAAAAHKKVLLVLNKCDLSTQEQRDASLAFYHQFLPDCEHFLLTATKKASTDALLERLKALLPTGPFLYDPEAVTTAYERDIAAELIREVILEKLQDEIPHCIAVTIESWKADGDRIAIQATLNLEREAHKGIVIGQGGRMVKAIRRESTARISELCNGAEIQLSLFVKVIPNWRKHKQFLKAIQLCE